MKKSYNDLIMNIKVNFDGKWKMKSMFIFICNKINIYIALSKE